MSLTSQKWSKYSWNHQNYQNIPETIENTKIPLKPIKSPKYTQKLKNEQNNPETSKMTKIALEPLKMTKIP